MNTLINVIIIIAGLKLSQETTEVKADWLNVYTALCWAVKKHKNSL